MAIQTTKFKGLLLFKPRIFEDERGYFFESFNAKIWAEAGINIEFVQDNESRSQYGTVRGLHYQISPFPQAKLVRVTKGKVLDTVVDLRKDQPTYGQSFSVVLSNKNKRQMYVPRGFAHGFSTLSKSAVFNYKCDNYYSGSDEKGIHPLDPKLNIDWRIPNGKMIISKKDQIAAAWGSHIDFS